TTTSAGTLRGCYPRIFPAPSSTGSKEPGTCLLWSGRINSATHSRCSSVAVEWGSIGESMGSAASPPLRGLHEPSTARPRYLHAGGATFDSAAAHADPGAAVSQPVALQHRTEAWPRNAQKSSAGSAAPDGALPRGGSGRRLHSRAARISAARHEPQID